MGKYNCVIEEFRNISPNDLDGVKYRMRIKVIPQEKINQPDEKEHQEIYKIDIACSATLISVWKLNSSGSDLEKVLCEYARHHFTEQFSKGKLSKDVTLNLNTSNTPPECPYDPDKIQCFPGCVFEVDEAPIILAVPRGQSPVEDVDATPMSIAVPRSQVPRRDKELKRTIEDIVCPECQQKGSLLIFGIHESDDNIEICSEVDLVCTNDIGDIGGCGMGMSIIDDESSPIDWVQRIAKYFPKSKDPIEVNKDENEPIILGFSYNGKNYDPIRTVFSCNQVEENISKTWYVLELSDGRALIQQIEDFNLTLGSQPEKWFLIELREGKTPYSKADIKHNISINYATPAYRILWEIENAFREIITNKFPDSDNLLKTITVSKPDGRRETLYDNLSRKKGTEESRLLIISQAQQMEQIDYMDWSDWITLFDDKARDLFSQFPNIGEAKKTIIRIIEEIQPIRNKIAHMRGVTMGDIDALRKAREKVNALL